MNKRVIKRNILLFLVLAILTFGYFFPTINTSLARAEESQTLKYFVPTDIDKSLYPKNSADRKLDVIQVVERDKELYLVVYQPSAEDKKYRATSINISFEDPIAINTVKHLEYVGNEDVFYTYKVKDYTVSSRNTRYYNITNIWRKAETDEQFLSGGRVLTEKAYKVAKCWQFKTENGNVNVSKKNQTVVEILNPYVGFVRYKNGLNSDKFFLYKDTAFDSHFVAFDYDITLEDGSKLNIDKLVEAELSYSTSSYRYDKWLTVSVTETIDKGQNVFHPNEIVCGQGSISTNGWFNSHTYTFDRIQKTDKFIEEILDRQTIYSGLIFEQKDKAKFNRGSDEALEKTKWVLRFLETDYSYDFNENGSGTNTHYIEEQTLVEDVTILRLKFITDGVTYNMGAVMDNQTGSKDPAIEIAPDTPQVKESIKDWFKIILAIIGILLLLFVIAKVVDFFSALFPKRNKKDSTEIKIVLDEDKIKKE